MAKVVHGITLTGDNKKFKSMMKESDNLLRKTTVSMEKMTSGLNKGFLQVQGTLNKLLGSLKGLSSFGTTGGGRGRGMGGLALGGLAAVGAAGGAFAASSIRARAQTAGLGIGLNAMGAGDRFRNNTALGYNAMDTLSQRRGLVTGVGGTGGGVQDVQALARATGLDPEQIIGSAGARRNIGSNGASGSLTAVRRTMGILSETLGKTFDKGRLGEFMSSIDKTLMSMGSGVNIDEKSFIKSFGALMKDPTMSASPNRAANALGNLDNTFKTASGQKFGLMAQIMQKAMGGEASGVDMMFEMRKGLFGKGGLGGGERSTKIFGAMKDTFSEMGMGGMSDEQSRLRALRMQDIFGIDGIDVAQKIGDAIVKGDLGKASEISGKFKTPQDLQKEALKVMSSTDGKITTTVSLLKNIQDDLGSKLIPAIFAIASKFGINYEQPDASRIRTGERSRALGSADLFNKPGFDYRSGSHENVGSVLRAFNSNSLSAEEQEKIKSALNQEIKEGKTLLGQTKDGQERETITALLTLLQKLSDKLDTMKTTNVVVQTQNGRGRTDVTSKNVGQTN